LSTGGPGVVRASYGSGKPAIGVGSGNAPVLVDETANLEQACGSLILGKTFDNGVICAAEQSVVVVKDVYEQFKKLLENRGVFFLYGEEREKLGQFMCKGSSINPDVVGQTALKIADLCGIGSQNIPPDTLVLGTEELNDDIGEEYPFSKEKLSPVLSMFKADSFEDGVNICGRLARNGGVGHSAGLYTSNNPDEASKREKVFVDNVPVGRVFVNSPTSLTAIGSAFNFEVDPSFTLGVGTLAGSSVSGNLGPMHLINTVTVAERQEHMEWFNLPSKVYFNRGCLEEGLRQCAKPRADGQRNERAMIISDKVNQKLGYVDRVENKLKELGFEVDVFLDVHPDPDMVCVRKGVAACESFRPDVMVCLGGGR
jgi:acetaldehyde dehydrogenase/alcohol dehydrogenase